MAHSVTLIPGDHTSPENCRAVQAVLAATGVDFEWDVQPAPDGDLPDALLASARRTSTVLMGYQRGKREAGKPAPIVSLRRALGTFAAIRPAQTIPAITNRHPGIDLVVVRETTEDVYANLEHESIPGVYESLKVTTRAACERIARFGFDFARHEGRKRVTIVHKANILKKADGLLLSTARHVAADYPDIEAEDVIVDALCMKLALFPERFDVLLCGNLFGDIVGDLASGLVGGRANCPTMNVGPDGLAVFTTGHGDPPDLEDPTCGNPVSLLFSAILMLRHLGEEDAANRLWKAILATLDAGTRPVTIGGEATCEAFARAISEALQR